MEEEPPLSAGIGWPPRGHGCVSSRRGAAVARDDGGVALAGLAGMEPEGRSLVIAVAPSVNRTYSVRGDATCVKVPANHSPNPEPRTRNLPRVVSCGDVTTVVTEAQ